MPVNGESKQWHERPAIVIKSNLKSILVFVKHSPGQHKEGPWNEEVCSPVV